VLMVQPVENQFWMSRFPTCLGSYPGYLSILKRSTFELRLGPRTERQLPDSRISVLSTHYTPASAQDFHRKVRMLWKTDFRNQYVGNEVDTPSTNRDRRGSAGSPYPRRKFCFSNCIFINTAERKILAPKYAPNSIILYPVLHS